MKWFNFTVLIFLCTACVRNNNTTTQQIKKTINISAESESLSLIGTDEFVFFWNKFSGALLANDTNVLSNSIDDKFHGYCGSLLDISNISKMDFKSDSIISKSRFLKEFKSSLNPAYLQLIKQYKILEDIKHVRTLEDAKNHYFCIKTVDKNIYNVSTYLAHENKNEKVIFKMSYMNDDKRYETKNIDLIFHKRNNETKLCEIDFYYSYIDEER